MIKFILSTRKMIPAILLITSTHCFGQNLIMNGSFASSSTNWTFFASATSVEAYASEISYGGPSATNTVSEVDAESNLRQVDIPVVIGQPYWFSFRHSRRTISSPDSVSVNVKIYNGTNIFLNQDIMSSNVTWDWTCESFQFTPVTNTVTLDIANTTAVSSTEGTILDDFTITPVEQPITLSGLNCQGSSVTLSAPFSSGPDASYSGFSWTGPNGFTSSDSIIFLSNLQASQSGIYTCTMQLNNCLTVEGSYDLVVTPGLFNLTRNICLGESYYFYGRTLFSSGQYDTTIAHPGFCDSIIMLQLIVNPKPDVSVNPSETDIDLCTGDSIILHVEKPDAGANYQWYKNGSPVSGETAHEYVVNSEGNYTLGAVWGACNDTSGTIRVTINPLPVAEITLLDKDIHCAYDTIRLMAAGGDDYRYFWKPASAFRSLTGSETQRVAGIFVNTDTKVVLDVYNKFGCFAADSITVYTKPCCDVFLPEAFSPNGDGLNDFFKPSLSVGQKILTFRVFDRYGKEVYNNSNVETGWSGNYPNTDKANADVYMYHLHYTCSDGNEYSKKGDLTLIR